MCCGLFLSIAFLSACSSTVEISDWQAIPNDTPVWIVTKSGSEMKFNRWVWRADSTFIGFTDTSALFLPGDSIQTASFVTSDTRVLRYVAVIGGIGLTLFLIGHTFDVFTELLH